ncbi:MAG: glycosyltransferase family 2 protein [Elusimicrobiota bacterium]|nr:glycosyltransferase family 2 protein [Elusimicrobiota bacterium]
MTSDHASKQGGVFCSIVIPCYNEAGNLPRLLSGFSAALKAADIELILVDNGSTDGTADLLRSAGADFPFFRAVTCERNLGYGGGILAGLRTAKGRCAGWTHGDMQYAPAEVLAAAESLRPFLSEKIFLKGLRGNRAAGDRFFTAGMALFASLSLGLRLEDINAQPTFFTRSLCEGWTDPPADFSLDLYAYADALARGYRLIRRRVPLERRRHGSSSWNRGFADRLRLCGRMAGAIFKIRKNLERDA